MYLFFHNKLERGSSHLNNNTLSNIVSILHIKPKRQNTLILTYQVPLPLAFSSLPSLIYHLPSLKNTVV